MLKILLITDIPTRLATLKKALEKHDDVSLFQAASGDEALAMAREQKDFDLAVADDQVGDMSGLEFAEKLLSVSAMINSAVVSSLSGDDFHEASEGLGLLMQLPEQPGESDAKELLTALRKIVQLTRPQS